MTRVRRTPIGGIGGNDGNKACAGCPIGCKKNKSKARVRKHASFLIVGGNLSPAMVRDERIMSFSGFDLFADQLEAAGFFDEDFSYCSYVRCAYNPDVYDSKQNRLIKKQCRVHLKQVIEHIKPDVVIPLGAEAASAVMGRAVKITKARGVPIWSQEFNCWVMATTPPHQVHLNPQMEGIFASDCNTLRRLVDYDYDVEEAGRSRLGTYEMVTDLQFLIDEDPEHLAVDTETQGLRFAGDDTDLLTIQLCPEPGRAYLVPWNHPESPIGKRQQALLRGQLRTLLCDPDRSYYGQNLKFDVLWIWEALGFRMRIDHDAKMLATLLDENLQSKDLDTLTKLYCPELAGYADAFNAKHDKSDMASVPLEEIVEYGCADTDASLRICTTLWNRVAEDDLLLNHYDTVSIPGLNTFVPIERRGQDTDPDALDEFEVALAAQVEEQYRRLIAQVPLEIQRDHAEKGLKFTRAEFVRDILFRHEAGYRLIPVVFTETTKNLSPERRVPSTSSKTHLPFFFDTCPFTVDLAAYTKANRLLGTNVRKFRQNYIMHDKVYPSYSLDTTVTGRTSCLRADQEVSIRGGKKRADTIVVGDEVFTHKGRFRPVTKLFRKPITDMVDISLSNGEVLHVTYDHVVLLESGEFVTVRSLLKEGVAYAKCIQEGHERPRVGAIGCKQVPDFYENGAGDSGRVRGESRYRERDDSTAYLRQGLQEVRALSLSRKQTGGEEPAVWEALGIRLSGWQGIPYEIGGRRAAICSPDGDGGDSRGGEVTGVGSRAPHRRRHTKQQSRQFGSNHKTGACGDTQPVCVSRRGVSIKAVEHSGSYRVYDFEVTEDHSYLAAGIFSHNSRDPNSQNYPKHGDLAKAYRAIFIPPPGRIQLEADYSQVELRIAADMANDTTMLDIYNSGGDIHVATAAAVMRMAMPEFLDLAKAQISEGRRQAKAVNFGFIYGMWWRSFVGYAKTSYGVDFTSYEAERIRNDFFRLYSRLEPWHNDMKQFAREQKYVRSYSGRIRHLPMVRSDDDGIVQEALRQAINSPVQEFASSLGVMAMARLEQNIDPQYLTASGFIHDAIYASVEPKYLLWGAQTMKRFMETNPIEEWFNIHMKVDMPAEVGFGLNGKDVYEMDGLDVRGAYDFSRFDLPFDLPPQEIPPHGGRYTPEPHLVFEGFLS